MRSAALGVPIGSREAVMRRTGCVRLIAEAGMAVGWGLVDGLV